LGAVSPAVRVRVVAGAAAVATAVVVIGVVAATRQDPVQPSARSCSPRKPYFVDGVTSAHEGAIRQAFSASSSRKTAIAVEPLAQLAPGDAAVQFNYGLALYCAGYLAEAVQAFEAAKKAGSDTFYKIRADSILHPQYFSQGYPIFQPEGRVDALLRQGIAEQTAGHQHSAERLYARAARLQPTDDQAQVAAAVGRFDESNLAASFSRLGPLVKRFPKSISVRYHLGLLLAWTGQRAEALVEFREAKRLGPHTELGREANAFVERLVTDRTDRTQR
jgi:tetratricopeptide (TPR) repeat protein